MTGNDYTEAFEDFSGSLYQDEERSTWLDVFPWMAGLDDLKWDVRIDPDDTGNYFSRIDDIALLAAEQAHMTVGELIPDLPASLDLLDIAITASIQRALIDNGVVTGQDLATLTIEDITDWHKLGATRRASLLSAVIHRSLEAAPEVTEVDVDELLEWDSMEPAADSGPAWVAHLAEQLQRLAEWNVAIGLPDAPLLGPQQPFTPAQITEVRADIERISAVGVLPPERASKDLSVLIDEEIAKLDERAPLILRKRTFADTPANLQSLGDELDLTRERVRQLENQYKDALLAALNGNTVMAAVIRSVNAMVQSVVRIEDLQLRIPALAEEVTSVGQPVWRVLDRFDDQYEIVDGWCLRPSEEEAVARTISQVEEAADEFGAASFLDVDKVPTSDESDSLLRTKKWLIRCGFTILDDHVLVHTGSVQDYGAAILSIEGTPMTTAEILEKFEEERTIRTARNAFAKDERIERTDLDTWGLVAWGLDSYMGIKPAIRKILEREGGEVPLRKLIEEITSSFTVSEKSVMSYAMQQPFESNGGVVSLASKSKRPDRQPEDTARMFRRWNSWIHRITINSEHLRGSASPLPTAAINLLDLDHGQSRTLPSPMGGQTVGWTGPQPYLGTIRRILHEQDFEEGDDVFLVFRNDGHFDIEPVAELTGAPLDDALRLAGGRPARAVATVRDRLATAIGLDAGAEVTDIIAALTKRGDDDIVTLLERHRNEKAGS